MPILTPKERLNFLIDKNKNIPNIIDKLNRTINDYKKNKSGDLALDSQLHEDIAKLKELRVTINHKLQLAKDTSDLAYKDFVRYHDVYSSAKVEYNKLLAFYDCSTQRLEKAGKDLKLTIETADTNRKRMIHHKQFLLQIKSIVMEETKDGFLLSYNDIPFVEELVHLKKQLIDMGVNIKPIKSLLGPHDTNQSISKIASDNINKRSLIKPPTKLKKINL